MKKTHEPDNKIGISTVVGIILVTIFLLSKDHSSRRFEIVKISDKKEVFVVYDMDFFGSYEDVNEYGNKVIVKTHEMLGFQSVVSDVYDQSKKNRNWKTVIVFLVTSNVDREGNFYKDRDSIFYYGPWEFDVDEVLKYKSYGYYYDVLQRDHDDLILHRKTSRNRMESLINTFD